MLNGRVSALRQGETIFRLNARTRPSPLWPRGIGDNSWSLGGSKVQADNKAWPNFRRNPVGRGQCSRLRCPSSLQDARYSSLLAPRGEEKLAPVAAVLIVLTGPSYVRSGCVETGSRSVLRSQAFDGTCLPGATRFLKPRQGDHVAGH
jgi:hypothetical protein